MKYYTWGQTPWLSAYPILFLRDEIEGIHKQLYSPVVKTDYYAQPDLCTSLLSLSGLNDVLFTRKQRSQNHQNLWKALSLQLSLQALHQEMLMACYVSAGITAVFLEQRSN